MDEETNGWDVWKNKVLSDTEDTKEETKELRKDFVTFQMEVVGELREIKTQISVRSSLWGAIAGILGAIGTGIIFIVVQ